MTQFFLEQLSQIRETLLLMSSLTDRSLTLSVRALVERDDSLADFVITEDCEVDALEIEVDEKVITYMATHGPIARDSRLMLAASKISTNLERIADQSTTIARRVKELNAEPTLGPSDEIVRMAAITQQMLHDAITAFVEGRFELAEEIIPRDKEVDRLNKEVLQRMIRLMTGQPETVARAVNHITIAKALERAADHVQNIAEEVYYLYRGEDIRHEKARDLR